MSGRPNFLFILSDQQRWDTLGCYGQPLPITPHLDALAASGVRFEHAFSCQPLCGPARASLQTGLYATRTGVYKNNVALPPDIPTLAKSLSSAGYETAYIGKWHLASDPQHNYRTRAVPRERRGGYDDYWLAADALEHTSSGYEGYVFDADSRRVDFEGYRADCIADFAVDWLRGYAQRRDAGVVKPFFLFVSFIEPHHQNDLARYIGPLGSKKRFADFQPPGDLAALPGDWKEQYPDYLGCCEALDANVGRLLGELQRAGLRDETILVYTSDHGSHFRTRNDAYKRSCHDSSIRIPLIISGPGFKGGRVLSEQVSLLDLPVTILEAAGATPLSAADGRPIQQLLDGGPCDETVYVQISESQIGRSIRTRRWKYAVEAQGVDLNCPRASEYTERHLYDLASDPHELKNLVDAPEYAATRAELAALLIRKACEAGEPELRILVG